MVRSVEGQAPVRFDRFGRVPYHPNGAIALCDRRRRRTVTGARQNRRVLLAAVAQTSDLVAATASRSAKVELMAAVLRRARPAEVPVLVAYLSGALTQRRSGVGYAALRGRPDAAPTASLDLLEVDAVFEQIAAASGPGAAEQRLRLLHDLLARATDPEQRLLAGLVTGELRQGALEGVLLAAVATAGGVGEPAVRSAVTLAGAVAPVAAAVLAEGAAGLARFRLHPGQPLRPMLAQSAESASDALERVGGTGGLEWKLDGIRVQVHRLGEQVSVFTRTLDDITERVPELVETVRALPGSSLVLDGEVIALAPDGRPLPFQVTGSRVGRRLDVAAARERVPLSTFFFDALHVDGDDLVTERGDVRWAALEAAVPPALRVPRLVTGSVEEAEQFLASALAHGHEGVVAKSLSLPYALGRRGAGWVKVKPVHTLDLVVLAAEWGHGRRTGVLSNLHLGARDPDGDYGPPGGFVMLGKTFKGLTDALLAWQTEQLLARATEQDRFVVLVRPELVVEVAFDGVQSSSRYPSGLTLRFARVVRYRPDKAAAEADTVAAVRALL